MCAYLDASEGVGGLGHWLRVSTTQMEGHECELSDIEIYCPIVFGL